MCFAEDACCIFKRTHVHFQSFNSIGKRREESYFRISLAWLYFFENVEKSITRFPCDID